MKRRWGVLTLIVLLLCATTFAPIPVEAKGGKHKTTSSSHRAQSKASHKKSTSPRVRSSSGHRSHSSVTQRKSSKPRVSSSSGHRKSYTTGVQRDSHGKIKRSESAKKAFMKQTGYPHGRQGYVIDHKIPLANGGKDDPSNMQWQTKAEAKAKDKWERKR